MCPSSAPSSFTSLDIGGNAIGYLTFLVSWRSGAPLSLGLRYSGVKMTGASLLVSIFGRSPLCHGDFHVEEILGNMTTLGGVVITTSSPPVSNCFIVSSILDFFDIHLLRTVRLNTSKNYRIHESNRSMGAPMVFIGFCLALLPTVIFPTVVAFNVNPSSSLTLPLCHQCTNETILCDRYSHFSPD